MPRQNWMKLLKRMMLPILILGSMTLTSCARPQPRATFFVIDGDDIKAMPNGTSYTSNRDGFFLSNVYIQKAMNVEVKKVERANGG